MADNKEIQKYNAKQEFTVERVYQKLTRGIDDLPQGEAVDALLEGVTRLRQGLNDLVDRIFQGAEVRQTVVMQQITSQWKNETENLQRAIAQATITGNYDAVEKCLRETTKANLTTKENVAKMKYIKQKGQTEYDPSKELNQFVKELETLVKAPSEQNPKLLK